MNKTKHISLFIIAALLLILFSACSGEPGNAPSSSPSTSSPPASNQPTSSPQTNTPPTASPPSTNIPAETPGEEITSSPEPQLGNQNGTVNSDLPVVYMTTDITPDGLMAIYEALNATPTGNVGIKVHTGESQNSNHLKPELIKDLVQLLDGTIVETNTAYGGRRASTAYHLQLAADHGFTAIAPVDIMDSDGVMELPIAGGTRLTINEVGASFTDYDYYVVLSHFKGHAMGGFGGAIKNVSIGFASAQGKSLIHTGGSSRSGFGMGTPANVFMEAMAESAKSITDHMDGNILYINVMNNISVDCDCVANPSRPDMHDIGILASLDPVALDQACVDLIYAAADGASVIARIESRNGVQTLEHAEAIGIGSRKYTLVSIDIS